MKKLNLILSMVILFVAISSNAERKIWYDNKSFVEGLIFQSDSQIEFGILEQLHSDAISNIDPELTTYKFSKVDNSSKMKILTTISERILKFHPVLAGKILSNFFDNKIIFKSKNITNEYQFEFSMDGIPEKFKATTLRMFKWIETEKYYLIDEQLVNQLNLLDWAKYYTYLTLEQLGFETTPLRLEALVNFIFSDSLRSANLSLFNQILESALNINFETRSGELTRRLEDSWLKVSNSNGKLNRMEYCGTFDGVTDINQLKGKTTLSVVNEAGELVGTIDVPLNDIDYAVDGLDLLTSSHNLYQYFEYYSGISSNLSGSSLDKTNIIQKFKVCFIPLNPNTIRITFIGTSFTSNDVLNNSQSDFLIDYLNGLNNKINADNLVRYHHTLELESRSVVDLEKRRQIRSDLDTLNLQILTIEAGIEQKVTIENADEFTKLVNSKLKSGITLGVGFENESGPELNFNWHGALPMIQMDQL